MAKDVAEWIDYSKRSDGSFRTTEMLLAVDDDKKVKIHTIVNNISGGSDTWFLSYLQGAVKAASLQNLPVLSPFS